MEYRTVFDFAEFGYKSWRFPASGLVFVAIGAILVLFRRRLRGWYGRPSRFSGVFPFLFLGFSVLWTVTAFSGAYREHACLSEAIVSGRASVVEGIVSRFQPMPYTGHAMEHFCVIDRCFDYSDYVITAGFNHTSSHGGPIREGLPVRITFVGNTIVKLEVAK